MARGSRICEQWQMAWRVGQRPARRKPGPSRTSRSGKGAGRCTPRLKGLLSPVSTFQREHRHARAAKPTGRERLTRLKPAGLFTGHPVRAVRACRRSSHGGRAADDAWAQWCGSHPPRLLHCKCAAKTSAESYVAPLGGRWGTSDTCATV